MEPKTSKYIRTEALSELKICYYFYELSWDTWIHSEFRKMPPKKQQEPVKKLRSSNSMATGNTAAANHDEDTRSQIPEIESSDPSAARAQSDRGNQWSDCGVEDNQVSVQISALRR